MSAGSGKTSAPAAHQQQALPARRGPNRVPSPAQRLWRRWNEAGPFDVPPRSEWSAGLRRARVVGLALLAVQLVALLWWSSVEANRGALTFDFSIFEQAAYLIAHGHIDPYLTIIQQDFWHDHGNLITWPLALFEYVWPHPVTLKWLGDLAYVGSGLVAFGCICDIAARAERRDQNVRIAVALVLVGAVFLAANPWTVWAASFDYHPEESFATLFLVAAVRDLLRSRRTVWLWVVLGLACGDLGASYIAAAGLSMALFGRRWLRPGLLAAGIGFGWLLLLSALHVDSGSAGLYANLVAGTNGAVPGNRSTLSMATATLLHPSGLLKTIWGGRTNIWANLSPSGLIGILWLPVFLPVAIPLAESILTGSPLFSAPGSQNFAVVPLTAVGTIALCAWLLSTHFGRKPWMMTAVLVVLAVNTCGWAAAWIPHTAQRWLVITPAAGAVVSRLEADIPASAQVVAENGVVGDFTGRNSAYMILHIRRPIPIRSRKVWFIFAPRQGIEVMPVVDADAGIAALTDRRSARLMVHSNGIWAFELTLPKGTRELSLDAQPTKPAPWLTVGPAAVAEEHGPVRDWYASSNGKPGYVTSYGYWRSRPGTYSINVSLSASGRANVEVWNTTTGALLVSRQVYHTSGRITVHVTAHLKTAPLEQVFQGWGPWISDQVVLLGDVLEVRVWQPGGNDRVNVYSVSYQKQARR
jgi:hypothetical protein